MTVRFDGAWDAALKLAYDIAGDNIDVIVVRDMLGRVTTILDDRVRGIDQGYVEHYRQALSRAAGPFASEDPVILASELFDPDQFFSSTDLKIGRDRHQNLGAIHIIERGVMGAEWTRNAANSRESQVALYGFKGGVGRSTAGVMLSQHLAEMGCCVLVADLDLESPGVGGMLQENEADLPEYGLVDYLVESAVNNADDLEIVGRVHNAISAHNGEIWLLPAGGRARDGYDYISKLNRIYTDFVGVSEEIQHQTFGARLQNAIDAAMQNVESLSRRPDVVLLDSRAGIHDIAAAAITQLSDLALLFATNSPATWAGYRALFAQWSSEEDRARSMRDKIRMVAAMVPPGAIESYLRAFRDKAQECFAETLYDDASADDFEAYNPGPDAIDAPHSPLPILFTGELLGADYALNPQWRESPLVRTAYEEFLSGATRLIIGEDS